MSFRITGLDHALFAPLFSLDDEGLAQRRAVRVTADSRPGFPCRIGLRDAEPGEELLLVNHCHQPAGSPYRATHAIYVARDSRGPAHVVDDVPDMLARRMLSLRAFDQRGFIVDAALTDGRDFRTALAPLLDRPDTDEVHVHFAARGCYAARVTRA
ncbi:DUF1203 domain-containing protein [uncultured Alsobacter sp.]|uniref:DUF1203 domain-containing protein n=1 Tax=uncultured Alsobacter sp. TaxID=1748258 RepID=UPI0025E595A1|nr:DUF1203 domain-containing protein [uncultured Alsobacter sp.]